MQIDNPKLNSLKYNVITQAKSSISLQFVISYRPVAVLFNAGCNEQMISPKPWKKTGADLFCRFWESCKSAYFNSKKWHHRAEVQATLVTS